MTTRSSAKCPECKSDIWDTWLDKNIATCANCGHERPYYERKCRDDRVTPSQKKAIKRIRQYFETHGKLARFETELQNGSGLVYITVETEGNIYITQGGFFAIGRRGGIRVLSSHSLYTKEGHYAKMLGGKVGW